MSYACFVFSAFYTYVCVDFAKYVIMLLVIDFAVHVLTYLWLLFKYTYINMYIYIYIYMERDRYGCISCLFMFALYKYIYIKIYILISSVRYSVRPFVRYLRVCVLI